MKPWPPYDPGKEFRDRSTDVGNLSLTRGTVSHLPAGTGLANPERVGWLPYASRDTPVSTLKVLTLKVQTLPA